MQELIFWLIFSIVAATLIITQTVAVTSKPTVPQLTSIELPDLSKKDPDAQLIYENEILSEKLSKFLEGKVVIYSLGESSGPTFNEKKHQRGSSTNSLSGFDCRTRNGEKQPYSTGYFTFQRGKSENNEYKNSRII